MGRELRIDGKVFDLTEELARRLGKSELEVVELALRPEAAHPSAARLAG